MSPEAEAPPHQGERLTGAEPLCRILRPLALVQNFGIWWVLVGGGLGGAIRKDFGFPSWNSRHRLTACPSLQTNYVFNRQRSKEPG